MTNDQPYRDALSEQEARDEIAAKAGLEFDPDVVSAFLSL
jgi:response regulator RpfG family c-di-GMP phosphodiesterase